MALELRNRLELSLGVTLSATLIWVTPLSPFLRRFSWRRWASARLSFNRRISPSRTFGNVRGGGDVRHDAAARLSEKLASLDEEYQ
jgi:hypothetical protein